eukprot:272509-Chlamydomonas_euryale.AAC.2
MPSPAHNTLDDARSSAHGPAASLSAPYNTLCPPPHTKRWTTPLLCAGPSSFTLRPTQHARCRCSCSVQEPAMLLGFVLIGRALEERAKLRASADMAALQDLVPTRARLALSNGGWAEVPADTVGQGDLIAVLPGDKVPVDGVVVSGRSSVNEAALTGVGCAGTGACACKGRAAARAVAWDACAGTGMGAQAQG